MVVAISGGKVCVLLGELSHCHGNLGWGWCQDDLLPGGPQAPSVGDNGWGEERKTQMSSGSQSSLHRDTVQMPAVLTFSLYSNV